MQKLLIVMVGIFVFAALIYFGGNALVGAIISSFPASAAEWIPLARIALWVIFVLMFSGIAMLIGVAVIGLIAHVLDIVEERQRRKARKTKLKENMDKWRKI